MKSNDFFRKHLYDRYLEKNKNPNYLSYSKILEHGFLNLKVVERANEDFLSPSRIPELEFSIPYWKSEKFFLSFDFLSTRFDDSKGNQYDIISTTLQIDRPLSLGYAKITPFLRLRDVFYLQKEDEINNTIVTPGLNLGFLAEKTIGSNSVYFSPSITFFSNFPSKEKANFSEDFYDHNPEGNFCSLNLAWDFRKNGVNTGNITITSLYNINNSEFDDSILLLNLNPAKNWSFQGQERFNLSKGGIKESNNTVFFKGKNFIAGIGNSYLSGYFNGVRTMLSWKKGDWETGFSINYDLKNEKFTSQRYYIKKRIHCLIAGLIYSKTSTSYIGITISPATF